jgi:ATP-dependent RNA circularization protein (DNA/RNA ligase family)
MMEEYHKIDTLYKRDPSGKHVLWGQYSRPEFEYLVDTEWVFTEKVDGTNIRVMWNGIAEKFGGKTDNAQIPPFLLDRLREVFHTGNLVEALGDQEACLYGEGYGAKIQGGGKYIADGVDFVLFDVKVGDWWLKREGVEDVALKLGIRVVPIVGYGTLAEMVDQVGCGFESQWGEFLAEGIVARPTVELKDRAGRRIITKLKHKDFMGRSDG